MMAGVMALAMIGGPLVGGTNHRSHGWRWSFYINLPLGAVALANGHRGPPPAQEEGKGKIDLPRRGPADRRHHLHGAGHHLGRHRVRLGSARSSA